MEPDPNPTMYAGILAEVPGVMMESDQEIATTAIEAVPATNLVARVAASDRSNVNFSQKPGVPMSKITEVTKEKKTTVIVIVNDSGNEYDGYDTEIPMQEYPRWSSVDIQQQ